MNKMMNLDLAQELHKFEIGVVKNVQRRVVLTQNRHKVSFDEIKALLATEKLDLIEAINMTEDTLDVDIFARIENGTAVESECNDWKRSLEEWQLLIEEALNTFEESKIVRKVA